MLSVDNSGFAWYSLCSDRVADTCEACDQGNSRGNSFFNWEIENAKPFLTYEQQITLLKKQRALYHFDENLRDFFRNIDTMGTDVTLEVLKTYMQGDKRIQTLFEYAAILGIQHIIKPYVEALI